MADYTSPHWDRAALILIDMQHDFVTGAAPVPGTEEVVAAVTQLAAAFRAAERPIAHVVRLYPPGDSDVDSLRRAAVESGARIVAPGTAGAEIVTGLLPVDAALDSSLLLSGRVQHVGAREIIIYKPRWSAFHRTELDEWLRNNECDTVVVAGCNLPNCPRATLFDASERDFRAVVVADAVSGRSAARLDDLALIGVAAASVEDVCAAVDEWRR